MYYKVNSETRTILDLREDQFVAAIQELYKLSGTTNLQPDGILVKMLELLNGGTALCWEKSTYCKPQQS